MEYDTMKRWERKGYKVVRSAGSHGIWDVCAVRPNTPVALIQCKLVADERIANSLLKKFRQAPPLMPDTHYHQILEVKIRGSKDVLSCTV